MSDTFKALVLEQSDDDFSAEFQDLRADDLPDGDVTVAVEYSTVNYKDGLVINGNLGRLVREFPHVPGIDFAGTVESSESDAYAPGDKVVLTGWRVGEVHWGGLAQKARVKSDWLVPLPEGLTTSQAMAVGTAGFTSMLCVDALEAHGLVPDGGEVLVTGGAGGVGSVAIAILANLGYTVVASTGRRSEDDYLRDLGASEILDRAELSEAEPKPLERERWAGCVDTVAGKTLATVLAQMKYGGSVAACGLAGGNTLETTVLPFLLRGVNVLGIDSVMQPAENRARIWQRIADSLPLDKLDAMTRTAPLSDVPDLAAAILKGQVRGRTVIDVNG
ncbi:MAG: oxidoreductase [Alphaproteobacteria bacterium]|nr:oxidoreductase [Alphaproteobacteria bacterium]